MEDINIAIIITTNCNLNCTYCGNNSGKDLKIKLNNNDQEEWKSSEQIIESLIKYLKLEILNLLNFLVENLY